MLSIFDFLSRPLLNGVSSFLSALMGVYALAFYAQHPVDKTLMHSIRMEG